MPADKESLVGLDEIARLLETHEGPPDARQAPPSPSRAGLRATGLVAAGALVAGSALGFGLSSSLTSPESARASFAGAGFLPARGWSVVQSGAVDSKGASHAVAANAPLGLEASAGSISNVTLSSLPRSGVAIAASFSTRGDPAVDIAFPARTLPLQMSQAAPMPDQIVAGRRIGQQRLYAAVGGSNIEARIFFGRGQPSAAMVDAAQRQLNRLSVGSERVTLFARPTLLSGSATFTELYGSVDTDRAEETVTIQAKDCGSDFFRTVAGAETRAGGGWSTRYYPAITTTLRAVWNDAASAPLTIQHQAHVFMNKRPRADEYYVGASGKRSFWRKRVVIERRSGGRWIKVRTVLLTDSYVLTGHSATSAEFKLSVPRGTLIRAVMPLSEAKPCYLAGTSKTVRA